MNIIKWIVTLWMVSLFGLQLFLTWVAAEQLTFVGWFYCASNACCYMFLIILVHFLSALEKQWDFKK